MGPTQMIILPTGLVFVSTAQSGATSARQVLCVLIVPMEIMSITAPACQSAQMAHICTTLPLLARISQLVESVLQYL